MKQGDILYKYQDFGRYAQYIVTAITKREKMTEYELECQSCQHGFKCRVLVKKVRGSDWYEFLCVINDEDEEWKAWHTTYKKSEMFYHTRKEAMLAVYQNAIDSQKSEISNHENIAHEKRKKLAELEAHFQNIKNEN